MKANIEDLKDSFKFGYESYESSRKEANSIWEQYHNRQYTQEQLSILHSRGQPAETFNVIKLFSRMLVGYYSTVVNTVKVSATNYRDVDRASLLNDTINYTFKDNRFDILGDQIKLGGFISGVLACEQTIQDTGRKDAFGRPINRIRYAHVPDSQLVFDPAHEQDDYSDASFLHRFKWVTEDNFIKLFGRGALEKVTAYNNFLNVDEAEFEFNYGTEFTGHYRIFNNYLVVHSVVDDVDGRRWSCYWSGDVLLKKEEITYRTTRWPYRIQFLHSSDVKEYYGLFREIIESQKAINQAIIKIQLMINSQKAFVEESSVGSMDDFRTNFNRVNSVIPVLKLAGVRVDNASAEVRDQYEIIDRGLDRIQRVLGINDSFLGMAYASDSGRKVKLQKDATIMSLRYVTARIESFYTSLGEDSANMIKQFYTANQVLAVSDEVVGDRWIELNKPITEYVQTDQGIEEKPILLPVEDPDTGNIMVKDDRVIIAPVNELESDLKNLETQIEVAASSYNDEDEKSQLLLETVMSGQVGQMMSQINPAGFFKMSALAMKSMKTKYSPNIVQVLEETASMLGGNPEANQEAAMIAQGGGAGEAGQPLSRSLKLPQNTNEGVE